MADTFCKSLSYCLQVIFLQKFLINLDRMDVHAAFNQGITFALFSQKWGFLRKFLNLHVQIFHFLISEVIDLLEYRIQKFLYTEIPHKQSPKLRCQFRKIQFFLKPYAQTLIQDRLIDQVQIVIKIITEFFQGINIRADILDIIRNLCFFCLA